MREVWLKTIAGSLAIAMVVTLSTADHFHVSVEHRGVALADIGAKSVEIHYAPAENLERIDVALIDGAGVSIDMAAYVLTDGAVIEALADAAARGVKARIWRDNSTSGYGDAAAIARLAAAGATIRIKPGPELMHMKSYCVDGEILRTGAANFSASGEKRQDNDIVVIRDKAACAGFEANFERLWGEK